MIRFLVLGTAVALALGGCTAAGTSTGQASPSAEATADGPHLLFEWYNGNDSVKSQFVADENARGAIAIATGIGEGKDHVHSDWSPDGKRIAFEVLDDAGDSIWFADADGGDPVETITCQTAACTQQAYPSWSPDGKSMVFVQGDGVPDNWGPASVVVIDLATKTRRTLAVTPGGEAAYYSPRWSPDGRQIIAQYETYPDATESTISSSTVVIMPADGSAPPRNLTDPTMFAGHPDWSPDGAQIVFDTYDLSAFFPISPAGTESNLYLMKPDGSGLKQLTTVRQKALQRIGEPTWTPDGTRIVACLASLVSTDDPHINNAMIVYVDPVTGEIDKTDVSGAQPRLQPMGSWT